MGSWVWEKASWKPTQSARRQHEHTRTPVSGQHGAVPEFVFQSRKAHRGRALGCALPLSGVLKGRRFVNLCDWQAIARATAWLPCAGVEPSRVVRDLTLGQHGHLGVPFFEGIIILVLEETVFESV